MIVAGYSPLYAQHQGYKAIKRPCIQSAFTDSCERIFQRRNIPFDRIVERYVDALDAPLIGEEHAARGCPNPKGPRHREAVSRSCDHGWKRRGISSISTAGSHAKWKCRVLRPGAHDHHSQRTHGAGSHGRQSNRPHEHCADRDDDAPQVAGALRETEWINLTSAVG